MKKQIALLFLLGASTLLTGCGTSFTVKDGPERNNVSITNYDRISVDKEVSVDVSLDKSHTESVGLINPDEVKKVLKEELGQKGISVTDNAPEKFTVSVHRFFVAGSTDQKSMGGEFTTLTGNMVTGLVSGAVFNTIRGPAQPWKVGFRILDDKGQVLTEFVHHNAFTGMGVEKAAELASDYMIPKAAAEFFELKK